MPSTRHENPYPENFAAVAGARNDCGADKCVASQTAGGPATFRRARAARETKPRPIRTKVTQANQQQSYRDLAEPSGRESNRQVQRLVLRSVRRWTGRVRPNGKTRAAVYSA